MVGEILGDRYEIQQQLGKKAGRQTLLARDLTTQDLVVLKILKFSSDFEWDDLKLFEREAATLRTLSHSSIPRYLDFFELDTPDIRGFALVQTYIPAKSLEEHRNAGRTFSEAEMTQLAKALLEILHYLHERHPPVIHRDLKPSNILLGNRTGHSVGQVYLVDFGSVQTIAARQGGTITVVGTYGYMPPEQFGGRAVPASDLYSLGATLIYLACGQHPADLPQKDLKLQFEPVVRLSPQLTSWLQRTIEPSLDRRFASVKDALQVLETPPLMETFPLTVSQPANSKIVIHQNAKNFEIVLPSTGFSAIDIIVAPILILFGVGFLQKSLSLLLLGISIKSIVFGLLSSGFILSIVFILLFSWFGKKKICIDFKNIKIVGQLFNFTYTQWKSISRPKEAEIDWIEYMDASFKYSGSQNLYYKISPKIIIHFSKGRYSIGGYKIDKTRYLYDWTEEETQWIARELGNWLGVPVRHRTNTSKP